MISQVDVTLYKERTMGRVVVKGQWLKSETTICLAEAQIYTENGMLSGYGTSKLLMIGNQQSMDDVVNYVGSGKMPAKFPAD
ncbi:MAG TPA: hypothetical protein VLR45_01240 [Desulfoprunum sp.]|nr:hypothetical protein [Desulfoprunum sp.]